MQLQPNSFQQRFNCPIAKERLKEPQYCVGNGHTYSKDEITAWLRHNPFKSYSHIGRMETNDLIPNKLAQSILAKLPTASSLKDLGVTYVEPMICIETGQTYDKKEIIDHFQKLMAAQREKGFFRCVLQIPRDEDPNRVHTQITLYPNLLFYPPETALPDQKPFILKPPANYIDFNPRYNTPFPPAIKDNNIRDLFSQLNALEGRHPCCNEEGSAIIRKIHTLAKVHGIQPVEGQQRGPNLSRLDLSGLVLGNLHILGGLVIGADFSRCTFRSPEMYYIRFVGCNFQNAKFLGGSWGSGETDPNFYTLSNFANASFIGGHWSFSKGSVIASPENIVAFKRALAADGAQNTDAIKINGT